MLVPAKSRSRKTPISINYTHDLLVIGAGSGGLGCAGFGALAGLKVALIDKSAKKFGGDCLNYGCVPSKALLHVAKQFHGGRMATEFGLEIGGKADFSRVMAYVHARQDVIRAHENPAYLKKEWGVDTYLGTATLTGRDTLMVNGKTLRAPRIVLATGSTARWPEVPGIEHVRAYDNESLFWELDELPEHLLVIGGGPNGCEMAQAFRRLGSRVTIVSRSERLLEREPAEVSRILTERLRAEGIEIILTSEVASLFPTLSKREGVSGGRAEIKSTEQDTTTTLDFSHALVAIGRRVRTEGLGLMEAGVEVQDGKIVTDEYYRTTNPNIYAVGDAYGREMFSHAAEMHNVGLWNNILSPLKKKHDLAHFSWVTFTDPEVAHFGRTAAELRQQGTEFTVEEISLKDDDRAIAANYDYGHLTLYLSKGNWFRGPKLLGGCMIAPGAGEMIQELHLLNTLKLPLGKLTNKIYAYPVGSRINQKAARDRTQRRLLSPTLTRLIRWWYRLRHGGVE